MPPLPSSADEAAQSTRVPGSSSTSTSAAVPAVNYTIIPAVDLQEALAGHRDGRIRNPVPSKLKGKTDGSKGNFGVMQIEVTGRGEATDRDAEAKRTSESTELAAKRAFENGYVSLRRSRFVHLPDEPVAQPSVPQPTAASAPAPAPTQPHRHTPLGPEETKSEQARLLTLLRSLHPLLVVDQICKALAFFGGIPGAPPPANGGFPESAEANGPGSLFVGWIAEIFPKLGGNSGQQQSADPARQPDNPQPVKRKRGRPKGSKATKARKDKGVKKGPNKASSSADPPLPSDGPNGSGEDVDGTSAVGAPDQVATNVILLTQATSPRPQLQTPDPSRVSRTPSQASNAATRTTLPESATPSGAAPDGTSSARRRGRPKGSRNRPKDAAANSMHSSGGTPQAGIQLSQGPHPPTEVSHAPKVNQTPQAATPTPAARQSFTAVNSMSPLPAKEKAGKARAPGSKPQQQRQNISQAAPATEQQGGAGNPALSNSGPPSTQVQAAPTYQVAQTIQGPQAQTLMQPSPPIASAAQSKPSKTGGQKRKRKDQNDAEASQSHLNDGRNGPAPAPLPSANSRTLPTPPSNARAPVPAVAPEPPPKRQRKGKEPRPSARDGNEVAAHSSPRAAVGAVAGAASSTPLSNVNPEAGPVNPTAARNFEPVLASSSVVEAPVPQQGRFDAQSPTVESIESQLQAEFDQQTDVEPQTFGPQSALDSTQLMASRLTKQNQHNKYPQHHPHQQQQQKHHQHHQHHQQQQQQQQQHGSVGHGRSPNPQPQPPQSRGASSPLVSQQQTRAPQVYHNQYRVSTSQLQHQHQHQQEEQPQQQQQQHQHQHQQQQQQQLQQQQQQRNYLSSQTEPSPQQQRHQLSGGQQHQSPQVSSAPQYSASTTQQQQYAPNQQPYAASQQQYSGVQHLASQQRYQHSLASSSAGTASYSAHQSPHFGTSTNAHFNSSDGSYRSPASALNNKPYGQRSQSGAAPFGSTSTHSLPQHSPQFGDGATGLQQRSASTSQPPSQSLQGMTNVQAFTGNTAADWSLFDTTHLDTSGQQGAMGGLSSAGYGIGAASMRASSSSGSAFANTGLATFDASGLGNSDRYYGVGRR